MHFAIVEDLVMDQKHLIRLIQERDDRQAQDYLLDKYKRKRTC